MTLPYARALALEICSLLEHSLIHSTRQHSVMIMERDYDLDGGHSRLSHALVLHPADLLALQRCVK